MSMITAKELIGKGKFIVADVCICYTTLAPYKKGGDVNA